MAEQQVFEGTWEEIAVQGARLAGSGKRVRLIVPSDGEEANHTAGMDAQTAAAIRLLEAWAEEDREMSPEEREEAEREWAELEAHLEADPVAMRIPKGD